MPICSFLLLSSHLSKGKIPSLPLPHKRTQERGEFTGSLALNWQSVDGRWQAGFAADHTGEQLDTDFGSFSTVTLPAYTLLSARLAWQLSPAAQIYLRGTNLSDEERVDVFGYASEGRGLFVGLRLGR